MGTLEIDNKSVVAPGEVIATGMDFVPTQGTYRLGDHIIASALGVVQVQGKVIKLIPLAGTYLPKRGDVIIGKIIDITLNGWIIETNSAYSAMLNLRDATSGFVRKGEDLTRYMRIDDVVVAKIYNVTSQNLVDLTLKGPGLRRLQGGRTFRVNCKKVPRIIGKQGSMVSLIKEITGCQIMVGQNGVVWINGEPSQEVIAETTIKKIENESHIPGLTLRIKDYLEQVTGKKIDESKFMMLNGNADAPQDAGSGQGPQGHDHGHDHHANKGDFQ